MKIRAWLLVGLGYLLLSVPARSQDIEALKKQLDDPDPAIRLKAAVGLGKHGKAAVPLVQSIMAKNLRKPASADMRNLAMQAIIQIGPDAHELIPDLLLVLHQYPKERAVAALALGKIGKESGEALSTFAKNKQYDPDIRKHALDALGHLGKGAGEHLDAMVANLTDGDKNVRTAAVTTLGKLGDTAKDAVGPLGRVANLDADPAVRVQATVAMCQVAPTADDTKKVIDTQLQNLDTAKPVIDIASKLGGNGVPLMAMALESKDQNIRFETLQAMLRAPTVDGRMLPALVPLLKDPVEGVKQAAVNVIGKVGAGPGSEEAAPAMGKLLADKQLRVQILPALERMGAGAGGAADDLGKLLLENDVAQTARVLQMLLKMGEGAGGSIGSLLIFNQTATEPQKAVVTKIIEGMGKNAAPALIKAIDSDQVVVRQSAAGMIGLLGAPAIEAGAGPALAKCLKDADPIVRQNALLSFEKVGLGMMAALKITLERETDAEKKALLIRSVGELGEHAKPAVPFLGDQLKDKSPLIRLAAAGALQKIGVAALDAVPKIAEMLADPDPKVRKAAAETLKNFGIEAKAAVPQLIKMLQSPRRDERVVAAETLINLEFASVPAVGNLLSTSPNQIVRLEAARVLHKLNTKAGEAAPDLIVALSDVNDEVRGLADDTLKQVPPDELVVHLEQARKSPHKQVRGKALDMLIHIGPKGKGSGGVILDYVLDKDPAISAQATKYFLDNRPVMLPFLMASMKSLDKDNKVAAARTLGRMGPAAAPALPALNEAAKDEDKDVAAAVAQAIAAISKKK